MNSMPAIKQTPSFQSEDRQTNIRQMGREIFDALQQDNPSVFNKNYRLGKIMEWSMRIPEFKLNLFRLVDVLPSLRSSAAIQKHVNEYLGAVASNLHGILGWGLNASPNSLRAKATSLFVRTGVQQMASMFIAGESAKAALKEIRRIRKNGMAFTVDLLGEIALSENEAEAYAARYLEVLDVLGKHVPAWQEGKSLMPGHPGESSPVCISIKLTALYSQCNSLNEEKSVEVLSRRLSKILESAKKIGALIYVDAEDMGNNPIIYQTFKRVFEMREFKDLPFPGIVIQAYAKNSKETLLNFIEYAKKRASPIAIRLVKGAYWDYETIVAAQNHWPSPLFSKKESSDANYEELSKILIDNHEFCLPAFGSHNIRSLSHACVYAKERGLSENDFELQMLYGMADPIARAFTEKGYLVRLYVPLGQAIPGMGYLVRRLLENTSNESFLRQTFHEDSDREKLLKEPKMLG